MVQAEDSVTREDITIALLQQFAMKKILLERFQQPVRDPLSLPPSVSALSVPRPPEEK